MQINSINTYQSSFNGKMIKPKKLPRIVEKKMPAGLTKGAIRMQDNDFGKGMAIGSGIFTGSSLYVSGRALVTMYC